MRKILKFYKPSIDSSNHSTDVKWLREAIIEKYPVCNVAVKLKNWQALKFLQIIKLEQLEQTNIALHFLSHNLWIRYTLNRLLLPGEIYLQVNCTFIKTWYFYIPEKDLRRLFSEIHLSAHLRLQELGC